MGYNGPPGSKTPPPNWWHMLILLLATIVLAKGLGMAYKRDVLDVYEREANHAKPGNGCLRCQRRGNVAMTGISQTANSF